MSAGGRSEGYALLEALVALAIGSLFLSLAFTIAGSAASRLAVQRADQAAVLLAGTLAHAAMAGAPAAAEQRPGPGRGGLQATVQRDVAVLLVEDAGGTPLGSPEAVRRLSIVVRQPSRGGSASAFDLSVVESGDAR